MIAELAQKHQRNGVPQPISLITMHTMAKLDVVEEELYLRERVIELESQQGAESSCIEAIIDIMGKLKSEGGVNVNFDHDDWLKIEDDLAPYLNHSEEINHALILYHILIWKTAGDSTWTMERHPNERTVVAYLPALLEACALEMSAEICSGSHLSPPEQQVSEEVKKHLCEAKAEWKEDDWQEISILEFVNATLPAKIDKAKGPTNQPVIQIIVAKDRNLSWRGATDSDNHTGEEVFESSDDRLYVRRTSDIRILYEYVPERMKRMCLGQFACEYRELSKSQCGYEKARNSINEHTFTGPDSEALVAGTLDLAAPQAMLLKNEKLMVRRQAVQAVPCLLYSGCSSKHGNQLMWSPWERLEQVTGEQIEEETDDQKNVRQQIFPLSVFPTLEDEIEDDDV